MGTLPNTPADRRTNPELREMFEQAYDVIRPFFDETTTWNKGHGHESLAFHALREQFPSLSSEQIFIIVTAAQRVFSTGGHIQSP